MLPNTFVVVLLLANLLYCCDGKKELTDKEKKLLMCPPSHVVAFIAKQQKDPKNTFIMCAKKTTENKASTNWVYDQHACACYVTKTPTMMTEIQTVEQFTMKCTKNVTSGEYETKGKKVPQCLSHGELDCDLMDKPLHTSADEDVMLRMNDTEEYTRIKLSKIEFRKEIKCDTLSSELKRGMNNITRFMCNQTWLAETKNAMDANYFAAMVGQYNEMDDGGRYKFGCRRKTPLNVTDAELYVSQKGEGFKKQCTLSESNIGNTQIRYSCSCDNVNHTLTDGTTKLTVKCGGEKMECKHTQPYTKGIRCLRQKHYCDSIATGGTDDTKTHNQLINPGQYNFPINRDNEMGTLEVSLAPIHFGEKIECFRLSETHTMGRVQLTCNNTHAYFYGQLVSVKIGEDNGCMEPECPPRTFTMEQNTLPYNAKPMQWLNDTWYLAADNETKDVVEELEVRGTHSVKLQCFDGYKDEKTSESFVTIECIDFQWAPPSESKCVKGASTVYASYGKLTNLVISIALLMHY